MDNYVICDQGQFYFFLLHLYTTLFSFLWLCAGSSSMMVIGMVRRNMLVFVPVLAGKTSSSSPSSVILAVDSLQMFFISEEVLFYP